MAEIQLLPVAPSQGGIDHILGLLTAAEEEGRDLGSRVPHIRMLARSLDGLAQKLDEAVQVLRRDLRASEIATPEDFEAWALLDRLIYEVCRLAELSNALPTDLPARPGFEP